MTVPVTHPGADAPAVELTGTVAGVLACGLVSNDDRIVIGSALHCDLVVTDPLVPSRACRIIHIKHHADASHACHTNWMLEVCRGARVYLNGELASREHLHFGDRLSIGCHRFTFDRHTPERRRHLHVDIRDLCKRLTASLEVPAAFLRNSADYQGLQRIRRALTAGGLLAILLLSLFVLFPPEPAFLNVEPPMEVVMVGEISRAPSPRSIRSLDQVERREIKSPETRFEDAQLATQPVPEQERQDSTFTRTETLSAADPTRPLIPAAPALHVTPELAPLTVTGPSRDRIELARTTAELSPQAPRRRLTLQEAANPVFRQELGKFDAPVPRATGQVAGFRSLAKVRESTPRQADTVSAPDTRGNLQMLLAQQASPLKFETHQGTRIPIARMPEALSVMDIKAKEEGVEFDGTVSEDEIAISWKSGQFRIHGPNPQPATPPTFCYVGRKQEGNQEYLYVSFVCEDPNVGALLSGASEGLWKDDSVELFLDTNADRRDYYHLIINCRGQHQDRYCANGDIGINNRGTGWNSQARIKTVVNPEARRWSAEILIPFSTLGGVPAKGGRWVVNFTRAFRGQGNPGSVYQNWFLVYNGHETNYHNPGLFGVFQW
ncbi:MAG: hypothetical protein A2498_04395 [Lentisphaerae bacterium RIFOXYC12_FULL_60_16]|nr:MAG: hypothetical protein A2498_04395 [Lentisphaerae bacterium RIFOXYC12_FULL_60_16]